MLRAILLAMLGMGALYVGLLAALWVLNAILYYARRDPIRDEGYESPEDRDRRLLESGRQVIDSQRERREKNRPL